MTTSMTLARRDEQAIVRPDDFMPVLDIEQAIDRYNAVVEFTKRVLKAGRDYGTIPGTERKQNDGNNDAPSCRNNTLLKPGAEKLCTLFGLVPDFEDYRIIEDWDRGFFYYAYKCNLTRGGRLVASGIGSCNSREKKYRRIVRTCPSCGSPTIKKSKYPPRNSGRPRDEGGWWCDPRQGGCGEEFTIDNPAMGAQNAGTNPDDACDQVNTLQKMAQKRALIAATLIATNASEFFTQDLEDLDFIDAEFKAIDEPPADNPPPAPLPAPKQSRRNSAATKEPPPPPPPATEQPREPSEQEKRRRGEWLIALAGRGASEHEATQLLDAMLRTKKKSIDDITDEQWQALLSKAGEGGYDELLRKYKPSDDEIRDGEVIRVLMEGAAKRHGQPDGAGIKAWELYVASLGYASDESKISLVARHGYLAAARAGAIDWATGKKLKTEQG